MIAVVNSGRVDYLRRQKHWDNEISVDEIPVTGDGVYEDPLPRSAPANEFDFEERRLADVFTKQKLLRRRILTSSFIEGLTAREVADRLKQPVEFVYSQKHEALKKIRDQLMEGGAHDGKR